jgi:hypothetical protein
MIRVNGKSVVYVICPLGVQTGGTELCHQLVDYLNNNDRESYIVYVSTNSLIVQGEIPSGFQKYNIKISTELKNDVENVVVFPETLFHLSKILKCDKMDYVFWWMSLDNYFFISNLAGYLKFKGKKIKTIFSKILNEFTRKYPTMTFKELRMLEAKSLNVYQSSYVNHFLLDRQIYNQLPLSDYINLDFVGENCFEVQKENIILYNPTKGFKVTKKIMERMKEYNFVPLQNLNRSQLQDLMKKAKIYIDFGNHPGKDRIPREAVINDCCIIVGKNGSAKYFQDVPIYESYKIADHDIDSICHKVKDVLNNYETRIDDFVLIKKEILKEKNIFEEEIRKIFL